MINFRHGSASHLSPQPVTTRISPSQHAALAAAAGQPLYHQTDIYRRPTVYVTAAGSQPPAGYLPAAAPAAYATAARTGVAGPPPAHHASARAPHAAPPPAAPLPAHMQFPSHAAAAAGPPPYGFAPLSPAKPQYQPSLWFAE